MTPNPYPTQGASNTAIADRRQISIRSKVDGGILPENGLIQLSNNTNINGDRSAKMIKENKPDQKIKIGKKYVKTATRGIIIETTNAELE